ncbi:MAG: hypothetical protein ACFB20_09235 [Opitutales bacterium]
MNEAYNTMNLTSYTYIPLATIALLSTSAFAQNLVVDQTGTLSGANGTTFIDFGTGAGASVLAADTDTLAEFAVGDQLSLSFLLSYSNFNSAAASNSSFSYGFQGDSDGLFYANLAGPEDLIAPTSELLTRPGSLFLGN